jgi:hypothetical protein
MKRTRLALGLTLLSCGGRAESSDAETNAEELHYEKCVTSCDLFRSGSQDTDCPEPLGRCEDDCNSERLREYKCTSQYEAQISCLVSAGASFNCREVEGVTLPVIDRNVAQCANEVEVFGVCICREYDVCEL